MRAGPGVQRERSGAARSWKPSESRRRVPVPGSGRAGAERSLPPAVRWGRHRRVRRRRVPPPGRRGRGRSLPAPLPGPAWRRPLPRVRGLPKQEGGRTVAVTFARTTRRPIAGLWERPALSLLALLCRRGARPSLRQRLSHGTPTGDGLPPLPAGVSRPRGGAAAAAPHTAGLPPPPPGPAGWLRPAWPRAGWPLGGRCAGRGAASSRRKMAAVTALRSSCRTAGRLVRVAGVLRVPAPFAGESGARRLRLAFVASPRRFLPAASGSPPCTKADSAGTGGSPQPCPRRCPCPRCPSAREARPNPRSVGRRSCPLPWGLPAFPHLDVFPLAAFPARRARASRDGPLPSSSCVTSRSSDYSTAQTFCCLAAVHQSLGVARDPCIEGEAGVSPESSNPRSCKLNCAGASPCFSV